MEYHKNIPLKYSRKILSPYLSNICSTGMIAGWIRKNESLPVEGFMEQANLKDKEHTSTAGSQLFQLITPGHISKPFIVPSNYVPVKYANNEGMLSQPAFSVQCFITRADQLGNLVDVN